MRSPGGTTAYSADLRGFLLPESGEVPVVRRYQGFKDGGGGLVERPALHQEGAVAETGPAETITVRFDREGGCLEADVTRLGLPSDWRNIGSIALEVENLATAVRFVFRLNGARGRIEKEIFLGGNGQAKIVLDIAELPLVQGIQPPWEPSSISCLVFDPQKPSTDWMRRSRKEEDGSACFQAALRMVQLICREKPTTADPVLVDAFGQRERAEWPGKITSREELRESVAKEELPPGGGEATDRDRRGGWTRREAGEGTGFFRVGKDADGRWWFHDPDGHPFWSFGVTGVRLTDATTLSGREDFFRALPTPAGGFAAARNPKSNSPANRSPDLETVGFYYWNVLRKYDTEADWARRVADRFRSWGLNTLGNWSEIDRFRDSGLAYTLTLTTRLDGFRRIGGRFPDLWEPGWEEAFEAEVRRRAQGREEDPALLGYFVDNELPWGRLEKELGSTPVASAAEYAEHYFAKVAEICRGVLPNHLYLGCRFVRRRPEEAVCRAAGRYCDVVTVNSYDLWPRRDQFGEWHELTGRPILLGEHHFPLRSPRQLPPLYPAFTEEERERLYRELVEKWARQPWSLGCHWFQWADQPPTGRASDGENQTIGFVDIADNPHADLVAAARFAAANLYKWHAAADL